jgi:hypothetical protein
LQKVKKPQRVGLQAITRYATSCGPDGFCNSAAPGSSVLAELFNRFLPCLVLRGYT